MATAELPRPCRDCGQAHISGKSRCVECREKILLSYKSRVENGQCVRCKKKAEVGAFCLNHWFRNIGSAHGLGSKEGVALLKQVWTAQDGKCAVTKQLLIPGHNASLDHIVPTSKGGTNDRSNLRWVLIAINRAKSDMTHEEFVQMCLSVVYSEGYPSHKQPSEELIARSN
jgi:hypothetical protein